MRDHGTDPQARFRLLHERVDAMKAIWTQEEASFHGEHVSFDRILCWPKPVQRPYPPVLVGGNGPKVLDRVLAFGDAWMPNVIDDDDLLRRAAELRRRAAGAGRAVTVIANAASTRPERLARYAEAGIERCVFYLPSGDAGAIERRLERIDSGIAAVA
jgi:alkanesulfonate monooxygenase SsuD/methylene tetrahydromethanopterin reductase-like flavin-dependent oxidoreductase (luciferase family)